MSWLTDIFCSNISAELETSQQENERLNNSLEQITDGNQSLYKEVNNLNLKYSKCLAECSSLEAQDKERENISQQQVSQIIDLKAQLEVKQTEITKLKFQIIKPVPVNELASRIRQIVIDSIEDLSFQDKGIIWWQLDKVLYLVFARPVVKYEVWNKVKVKNEIEKHYPAYPSAYSLTKGFEFADGLYRVTDYETMKQIVEESYIPNMQWLKDTFDCDDFARQFVVHLTRYLLNSGAVVYGNSPMGYHAFNLIICTDGLAMLEPQNGQIAKVKDGGLEGYLPKKLRDL